ncbi:MAG: ABC transporter substrate-binding protein [Lachnospiraceae bacterium]|nr:ABC transporter substrate-binding protein [Lachnospiraceae bacterium]MDD6667589.1 ABC transporter substrate-binding protein [Lachnospiraceae bacterium]
MKKRLLAALMTAALSMSLLAGCGSGSGSASSKSSSGSKSSKTYQVGIVQLTQHPALDAATKGFKKALTDKLGDKVKFDEQNASGDSATCTTIANSFVSSGKDLIMANATAALTAASQATSDIPIVGTSVTDYGSALDMKDWSGKSGTNVSGTTDLAPLDEQAKMIQELFPDKKKVGILYCNAEANSKYQVTNITKYLEDEGYTVTEYSFSDSNDVANVAKKACGDSDVLYIPTDNTAASCAENINNVAEPAGIPIVTGEEGICKGCGVATLSLSYYDLGYQTGEMAYDILVNGKNPGDMEVQTAKKFTKEYMKDRAVKLGVTIPDDYEEIKSE